MQDSRLKVGLALGAGGARGLAHLGVLEVLKREGIKIDMIAGTSMGSLIGGLYACEVPLKYLKKLAHVLNWDHITDVTFPRQGLIKGNKLLSFLELLTKGKNISSLDIPFAAICCDIEKGEHVVLNQGSVAEAIRASTSIPGIYVPYRYNNKLLVDGGVLDRVPVSTVQSMGSNLVIAVDVGVNNVDSEVNNIFDILLNTFDIMQREFENLKKIESDVIIRPELEGISAFDLENASYCIKAGYRAAEDSLDKIKYLLRRGLNE